MADLVAVGKDNIKQPVDFYAFEWTDEGAGKSIKSIRLKGIKDFEDYKGDLISEDAIYLFAVSYVYKHNSDDFHKARFNSYCLKQH